VIKRYKKKCTGCKNKEYLFGHGLCRQCYNIKYLKPIPTSKIPINKISNSQKKRHANYMLLRNEYLLENPICERCNLHFATECHHKKGKDGINLFRHFMAVCRKCHQYIEVNSKEAKEEGWTISRINEE
jgi:hypothetical protein